MIRDYLEEKDDLSKEISCKMLVKYGAFRGGIDSGELESKAGDDVEGGRWRVEGGRWKMEGCKVKCVFTVVDN